MDINKDGVLDKSEVKKGMKEVIGSSTKSEKEWLKFYKTMDLDGDGQVSFEEF